ncbi:MAG: ABC transporter substrate-binding protein [Jatrophihabitans sp.]|nr:MAG: ABC transporter substrate-binding protein [Jatrophihabitans sp.]
MKRTRILSASLALVAAAALAACGSSGSSGKAANTGGNGSSAPAAAQSTFPSQPGSIVVGSADFPENQLLALIYGDAMAAKGVKVTQRPNIGERSVYMTALQDGSIDFIPEYSGSILAYLDSTATAKSPADVYTALQTVAASKGLVALKYAAAQDSDTITVTKATADKYHLSSIADLQPIAANLTFGAPAQFQTRPDGIPALKSVYGVVFGTFTPLKAGGTFTVTALQDGSVQAADVFSTDPAMKKYGFVALKDPKSMFAAQNIVPIAKAGKISQPAVNACNAVSAKLDTATLLDLVSQVAGGADPATVATQWLASVGLG